METVLLADAEAAKLGKFHTVGDPMRSLAVCGQSGGQEIQHGPGSPRRPMTPGTVALTLRLGTTAAPPLSLLEDLSKFLNSSNCLSLVTDIAAPHTSTKYYLPQTPPMLHEAKNR